MEFIIASISLLPLSEDVLVCAASRAACLVFSEFWLIIEEDSSRVAEVSIDILSSLKINGRRFDGAALEAAAMLHDIAKIEKNHALEGEKVLKEIGYENVGYIISTHKDIDIDENGEVTENEILYLADKLVKEDMIIPIGERMKQCIDEYGHNHEALGKIRNRFENAERIIKKIEKITGKGFAYGKDNLSGKAR
jgi:predicted metal-dependent hydrolase